MDIDADIELSETYTSGKWDKRNVSGNDLLKEGQRAKINTRQQINLL